VLVAVAIAAVILWTRGDGGGDRGASRPPTPSPTDAAVLVGGIPAPSASPAPSLSPSPVPSVAPSTTPGPSPSPPPATPAPTLAPSVDRGGATASVVVVKPYGAALRASPAGDARILVTVGCNTILRVLEASAGWYRVSTGRVEGWVGGARVADAGNPPRFDCTNAVTYQVGDPVVTFVQSGCLSLRETPSRSAAILQCVENGTRYTIVNGPIDVDGEDWFEVSAPRIGRGWSLAQFLRPAP
jgi:hypothetical protein